MSDVITIRVPHKTKEKLQKYKINVSETVRKALEQCVKEIEEKDLEQKLEKAKRLGKKIDPQILAEIIRQDREGR